MDAVKFIKERNRMCQSLHSCNKCPLVAIPCENIEGMTNKIEEIVSIIEQWSEEHPQKTMMQDFFEKFPNAPKSEDNTPKNICPNCCGYTDEPDLLSICDKFDNDCLRCWSRPLED